MMRITLPDESSICLRMKGVKGSPVVRSQQDSTCEIVETLAIMKVQDLQYKCGDYLSRCQCQKEGSLVATRLDVDSCTFKDCEEPIDTVCREKMVDWALRVSDHFQTSREIVSYAFSFLDRFVDLCTCDRTAFKLASMTSLYMATKLFNPKQISIVSLAELSRGEFEVGHIAEMERVILKTLEWKLNPPTIQAFIGLLHRFVSLEDGVLGNAIHQRATFFAELALYDYELVTESRLQLAIASILNAIEGIDDSAESRLLQKEFLREVESGMSISLSLHRIDEIQGRLWFLYSCSAQLQDDDAFLHHNSSKRHLLQKGNMRGMESLSHSPVSVRQNRHY